MSRLDITENLGALVDIEDGMRITFDLNPDSFEDSKNINLAEISIPGMSHPRLQFSNGGSRVVSFTIFLHSGATENVENAIKILSSWLYPEYEDGELKKAPHKLLLVFGDTWADEKFLLRSCNVNRMRFDKNLACTLASAAVELIEFIDESKGVEDVAPR